MQFDLCISPLGQKPREEHLKWIFYFRKIYLWKNGRYLTLSLSTIKVFVSFVSKLRMYIPAQAYLCKIIRVFSPTDLEQTSFWIAAIFSVSVAKFSKLVNFKKSKNNDKATRYMAGLNTYSWGLSRLFRVKARYWVISLFYGILQYPQTFSVKWNFMVLKPDLYLGFLELWFSKH